MSTNTTPSTPARAPAARTHDDPPDNARPPGSIPETLIALVISLAMAFIAKNYVIEAYRIPTGSMAPTLLGAHMRFDGPQTGHDWTVDNWYYRDLRAPDPVPTPIQDGRLLRPDRRTTVNRNPPAVTDPMTGPIPHPPSTAPKPGSPLPAPTPNHAGDRILVQKYLYEFTDPKRFDVAVFRNPSNVLVNYIKRIVGLPNEALWLIDGDVFTRPLSADERDTLTNPTDALVPTSPQDPRERDWQIQRKPPQIQQHVWRPVFHAQHTPLDPTTPLGDRFFTAPWQADSGDWTLQDQPHYTLNSDAGTITWDTDAWPIDDFIPFNENVRQDATTAIRPAASQTRFPIADVRLQFTLLPDPDNTTASSATFTLDTRRHTFTIAVADNTATLSITDPEGNTTTPVSAPAPTLSPGEPATIAFEHYDQSLSLTINNTPVIEQHPYDIGPAERILNTTGRPIDDFIVARGGARTNGLHEPRTYANAQPRIALAIAGGPATLHRLNLDKDLYYRPNIVDPFNGLADSPERIAVLDDDEFFALGDNSAASLDSRGWQRSRLDPWAARAMQEWADEPDALAPVGVVPRKLLLGRAFFVYWPAAYRPFNLFVPDFGRMRFIY